MAFKPGDTVKLKSDGPEMTVHSIDGAGVHCQWWSKKDGKFLLDSFPEASLERSSGPVV